MLRKAIKFARLSAGEQKLLLQIALLVPALELSLKTMGFRRASGLLVRLSPYRTSGGNANPKKPGEYRSVMLLYYRNFPFKGNCLARSMTLWYLLRRDGIESDLRFGTRKKDGKLLAHAWVEHRGQSLDHDFEPDSSYIPFTEPILPETARSSN